MVSFRLKASATVQCPPRLTQALAHHAHTLSTKSTLTQASHAQMSTSADICLPQDLLFQHTQITHTHPPPQSAARCFSTSTLGIATGSRLRSSPAPPQTRGRLTARPPEKAAARRRRRAASAATRLPPRAARSPRCARCAPGRSRGRSAPGRQWRAAQARAAHGRTLSRAARQPLRVPSCLWRRRSQAARRRQRARLIRAPCPRPRSQPRRARRAAGARRPGLERRCWLRAAPPARAARARRGTRRLGTAAAQAPALGAG
jgi:hypothetical protein